MLKAAAATKVLDKSLDDLSGSSVRMERSTDRASRSTQKAGSNARTAARDVDNLGSSAKRTGSQIDTLSGRVSLLASGIAVLGPGLIPLGAVGIPALTGLASGLGFAAAGTGVLIAGFQGVGDALKAVNKAAIEPTKENLAAADQAMAQLGPDAQTFVSRLRQTLPYLKQLRDLSAKGMFPGFTEGIDGLEQAEPRITRIVGVISQAIGDIGGEAGQSLGSERWAPFLDFVADEAPQALHDLASVAGSTGHALAELWMAFDPLNDDVANVLVRGAADFDKWASGLSKTQGFQEFVNYIETTGPQVGATLASIANAFLQILEAGAPIGGPVLHALEDVADVIATIADSDLGTPILTAVAGFSALRLATKAWGSVTDSTIGKAIRGQGALVESQRKLTTGVRQFGRDVKSSWNVGYMGKQSDEATAATKRLSGQLRATVKAGAGLAALGIAATGAADGIGLTSTASLGLLGFSVGGPVGAALGAGAGLITDMWHSTDDATDALTRLNAAARTNDLDQLNSSIAAAKKQIDGAGNFDGFVDGLSDTLKGVKGAFQQTFTGHNWLGDLKDGLQGAELQASSVRIRAGMDLLDQGFTLTAAGAHTAAMSNAEFTQSLQDMYAALDQRATLRDLEASIDDYRETLKKARQDAKESGTKLIVDGKINIDTAPGRAVQAALDNIAQKGLKAAESVSDVGKRARLIDKTRAAFIRAAEAAGIARADARRLANQLINVGQLNIQPKISLNLGTARAQLHQFVQEVSGTTATVHLSASKPSGLGGLFPTSADGSTVPKTGRPYADRHLYLLADGEEVISNRRGQADRHRPLLKAINADLLADGGTTGFRGLAAGGTAVATNGVSIQFPMPAVLSAAVRAANEIAVLNAKTARSVQEQRAAYDEIVHAQQQVRDLQHSLEEHNTKVVGKGKDRHTVTLGLKLTGLDRAAAKADLAVAKDELAALRNVTTAVSDLRQARLDAAKQYGTVDIFSRGNSGTGALSSVERQITDVTTLGETVTALRARGASGGILQSILDHATNGDYRGANRLGQSLLSQPLLLGRLNAAYGRLSSASLSLAATTTDPRFTGGGRWDPRGQVAHTVSEQRVVVGLDKDAVTNEVVRRVEHIFTARLNG